MLGEKYIGLTNYLIKSESLDMKMSFEEVKKANDDYLPESAYKYVQWWGNNSKGHTQAFGWLNAGYETHNVNIVNGEVWFKKI